MPHEIDTTTGKAAVFATGEPAWHRLGKVIDKAATSAEAIGLAGLDWHVDQWPLSVTDPDGVSSVVSKERVANVRTNIQENLCIPNYFITQ